MEKATFYIILSTVFPLYILISIYLYIRLHNYVKKTSRVLSKDDIGDLKSEIKKQMYGALFMGACSVIIIGSIVLVNSLSSLEFVFLILIFIGGLVFSGYARKLEEKIVNLDAQSQEIEDEKQHIVKVWHSKVLPRFDR